MGLHRKALCVAGLAGAAILAVATPATAAIGITRTDDATALANALVGGAGAGITVTNATLSSPGTGALGELSSGVFTLTTTPDTYGLAKGGIVLSTGDVADDQASANTTPCVGSSDCLSYNYLSSGSGPQETLLDPICNGNHYDVTQLDLTFDVGTGVTALAITLVFASDEYPTYIVPTGYDDCFGLFVNGTNYAMANGDPFLVENPGFDNASGTQLNGVLTADNGSGVEEHVNLTIPVVGDSIGNTMTLILADRTDHSFDSAVYVSALGASPAIGIFGDNFEGGNLACWSTQIGGAGGGTCTRGDMPVPEALLPVRELPWDHVLPANLRVVPQS